MLTEELKNQTRNINLSAYSNRLYDNLYNRPR